MSHASTAAPIAPAESLFGVPAFTKIDAAGAALPPTAESWAAVRVTLGNQSIEVLVGNVGGRAMTHADAIEACANVDALGSRDWRLPTRRELESLVDTTQYNPSTDPAFFPDFRSGWYWSASPVASDPECAWGVAFDYGLAYLYHRDGHGWVRAVRSVGPAAASQ